MKVRELTEALVSTLSDADASAQAMPDASPAKWHLAHTTWFFETFVLRAFVPKYRLFDARYHFLFNSYYEAEGPRLARPSRGLLTRPSLKEIERYRHYVTASVLDTFMGLPSGALEALELGCHHEEQHQELLQTGILYLFSCNPLSPAVWPRSEHSKKVSAAAEFEWVPGREGLVEIGHAGNGFAFDCELPPHKSWLTPHLLGSRPVSNAEWCEFISDGAYQAAGLWLSDGWSWVCRNNIEAPLHWRRGTGNQWESQFALDGVSTLIPEAPVCHVSYFEADAFARWAGARLPTEPEWESSALLANPNAGNFLDGPGPVSPRAADGGAGIQQLFGDVWEWTGSSFLPYPGFKNMLLVPSANTTASSCRDNSCFEAVAVRRRTVTPAPATEISSIPISAGSTPAFDLPRTFDDDCLRLRAGGWPAASRLRFSGRRVGRTVRRSAGNTGALAL